MDKNIRISEEAYDKINKHAGKSDKSLYKALNELLGVSKVSTPDNLRHTIHGIIKVVQGDYENLQPVSRKTIIEQVKVKYKLDAIAPVWLSLASVVHSKFYNDIDNELKRMLKDGDIEKVDTGKYTAEKRLE